MTARRRGAALWPGLTLACLLAVLAFVLSFDALRIVALACGVQPALAWMFPLIVDGSTLAFTWATWAFRTRGMGTWYPWLMLVLFSVVSLIGNALHAHPVQVNGMLLPDWVPPLVMTMPPIALLATTHMIVMAAGRTFDAQPDEPDREPMPDAGGRSAIAPEPEPPAAESEPEPSAPVPESSEPEPMGETVPATPEPEPSEPGPEPATPVPPPPARPVAPPRRGAPGGGGAHDRGAGPVFFFGGAPRGRRGGPPTITIVTRRRPWRRARARAPRHALHGRASYARGSGR